MKSPNVAGKKRKHIVIYILKTNILTWLIKWWCIPLKVMMDTIKSDDEYHQKWWWIPLKVMMDTIKSDNEYH